MELPRDATRCRLSRRDNIIRRINLLSEAPVTPMDLVSSEGATTYYLPRPRASPSPTFPPCDASGPSIGFEGSVDSDWGGTDRGTGKVTTGTAEQQQQQQQVPYYRWNGFTRSRLYCAVGTRWTSSGHCVRCTGDRDR